MYYKTLSENLRDDLNSYISFRPLSGGLYRRGEDGYSLQQCMEEGYTYPGFIMEVEDMLLSIAYLEEFNFPGVSRPECTTILSKDNIITIHI